MSEVPGFAPKRSGDSVIVVRHSEAEDRARANAVRWAAGWAEPPARHHLWPEADADWVAQRYYREFVAEVDGIIAGRIGLEAYRPPFAELVDLSVLPDYRRRGLARLLGRRSDRRSRLLRDGRGTCPGRPPAQPNSGR